MKTVEQAHAAGKRDGEQGLGALAPRNGPAGSLAHRLHAAYMQSYRDALVARVGVGPSKPRGRNPRPSRDPAGMSAADINRELDRADKLGSQIATELIAAGRGHELPTETVKKSDPLSVRLKTHFARRYALRNEVERRYGPGAPSRLPRGFGPIRTANRRPVKRAARRRRVPRGQVVTTVTQSKVIRRTNRSALHVLYASKPGHARLKYLGRGKFGARGRPVLFRSAAEGNLVGRVLVDAFPQIMRGWTVSAGTAESTATRTHRRPLLQGVDLAAQLHREQARRDSEAAHRWLAKQKK